MQCLTYGKGLYFFNHRNPSAKLIIPVLLSFIKNEEIKKFLKKSYRYDFYIPSNPLFNYPSFIKQINFSCLFECVHSLLQCVNCVNMDKFKNICGKTVYFVDSNMEMALAEIIFRTVIKNTSGLEVIEFFHDYCIYTEEHDYDIPSAFYEIFFELKDFQRCLKNLRKVRIQLKKGEWDLTEQIMKYAHNVKEISSITIFGESPSKSSLVKLLLSQGNLKKVSLGHKLIIDHTNERMTPSLESLRLMRGCDISGSLLQFFANCNQLRKLIISSVRFLSSSNKILEEIIFPNLKVLELSFFEVESEHEEKNVKQFLVHHIKNLRKLSIHGFYEYDKYKSFANIPSLLIFENNCSNLTYLLVEIYYESQISDILIILKISKNLKELQLLMKNNTIKPILEDQFLIDLSLSCKNLKVLNVDSLKMTISGLKILLTQSMLRLRRLDCFIHNGNSYHVERLIQKYEEFDDRRISSYTKKEVKKDFYGVEEYCNNYYVVIEWIYNI